MKLSSILAGQQPFVITDERFQGINALGIVRCMRAFHNNEVVEDLVNSTGKILVIEDGWATRLLPEDTEVEKVE